MALDTDGPQANSPEFRNSVAVVIGIDRYEHGIPALRTAVADAHRVGEILEADHGYRVREVLDEAASLDALTHLFTQELPAELGPDDRFLLYYAGHGVALDGDEGPNGYLLPQDARRGDESTFLHMPLLHDALLKLECRHVLVVFDSCFSGAFRWSGTRSLGTAIPNVIHQERYDRFISDPAWQVISSSAHDQVALDQLTTGSLGSRGETGAHSPFALALFEALEGAGDVVPVDGDGVITATELYLYLEQRLQPETLREGLRQTPRLWPLKKHDKGEFIFLVPGYELDLPPAPPLTYENNPYRGLQSYDQSHASLFFGRTAQIAQLRAHLSTRPLTVVLGASGTGKSSLVKAGLLPALAEDEHEGWHILPVIRPGASPLRSIAAAVGATRSESTGTTPSVEETFAALAQAVARHPDGRLVLVVDQLEEVVTLSRSEKSRHQFLRLIARIVTELGDQVRLILTLRSDFELSFLDSPLGDLWSEARFVVPPMDLEALREVIEGPASQRVLYFESPELIDALVAEVLQSPGALPLLSFTLSEMYIRYVDRRSNDRALTWQDYNDLGGVVGALRFRAREEYNKLDEAHQEAMRLVLLRMVAFEHGSLTRRRVPRSELEYPTAEQNTRADTVIRQLTQQRLLVEGTDESGEAYVEPAHDALVAAWDKLLKWIHEAEQGLADLHLQRRLASDAAEWERDERRGRSLLWDEAARAALLGKLVSKKNRAVWLNRRELEFARKSIGRWKLFLGAGILVGLFVVGLAASTTVGFVQARASQRAAADSAVVAQAQRDSARTASERALRGQSMFLADLARQQNQDNQFVLGGLLALEALPRSMAEPDRPYVPAAEVQLYAALPNLSNNSVLEGHSGRVTFAAWSPDGSRIVTVSHDRTARVWDAGTGALINSFSHEGRVAHAAFRPPDGRQLLTAGDDRSARLWDVETGLEVDRISWSPPSAGNWADFYYHVSFSNDGRYAGLASSLSSASLWDLETGERTRLPAGGFVVHTVVSPDSRWILTSDRMNGEATLLDLATTRSVATLQGHTGGHYSVAFHPNSAIVLTASADNTARLWRVPSGEQIAVLQGHTDKVYHAEFSPAGDYIVTASKDGTARVWETETGALATTLIGHTDEVRHASFSPDGRNIITSSRDDTSILWDVDTGAKLGTYAGHRGDVTHAAFSPDGSRILTTGGSTARVWGVSLSGALTLAGHQEPVVDAVYSPDGTKIATSSGLYLAYGESSRDSSIRLWDAGTGAPLGRLVGHEGYVEQLQFSPDGRLLLSRGTDSSARIWDVERMTQIDSLTGGSVGVVRFSPDASHVAVGGRGLAVYERATGQWTRLEGHSRALDARGFPVAVMESLAFTEDGATLASGATDGSIILWDVESGSLKARLSGHGETVKDLEFALDDTRLVSVSGDKQYYKESADNTIRVWDVESGNQEAVLDAHGEMINDLTFSEDGRMFATASGEDAEGGSTGSLSRDNSVRVWTTEDWQLLATLEGHAGPVRRVSFNRSGTRLATASDDRTARVWDLAKGEPIAVFSFRNGVNNAVFSPSGDALVTVSGSRYADVPEYRANVWRLYPDTQTLLAQARALLGPRQLSPEERARFFVGESPTATPEGEGAH